MKTVLILALAAAGGVLLVTDRYLKAGAVSETERLKMIADHVNSLGTTWTADAYEGEDISFALGKLDAGLMASNIGLGVKDFPREELTDVPESFDSRDQWPDCQSIREIRNQAKCGSCWAFSAATVMSDRICIASGQKLQTRVSPQDVLTCCYSCGKGCSGGFPSAAWFYFVNNGVVTGNNFDDNSMCKPYTISPTSNETAVTPQCKRSCVNGKSYYEDKIYAKSAYLVVGEEQFKAEISKNGPISASLTTYEDLKSYKTGIYSHMTGVVRGGHSIRIVGYGSEKGQPYWIIANSWTEKWGEAGFFRMKRGTNEGGIETEGVAGLVDISN